MSQTLHCVKKLDYLCNCKSEISNVCNAVEGHCLQAMKIVQAVYTKTNGGDFSFYFMPCQSSLLSTVMSFFYKDKWWLDENMSVIFCMENI